jgi:hypothetical protein
MSPGRLICRLVLLLAIVPSLVWAAPDQVISHRAHVQFDVAAHRVVIRDQVLLPPGLTELRLGAGFTITSLTSLDRAKVDVNVAVEAATDDDGPYQRLFVGHMGLRNGGPLTLTCEGTFNESVEGVVFSRENVGNEITATISDEGIYLSSAAGWLVTAEGVMATYELAIDTPAGFETVTQGERVLHQESAAGLQTRWVADQPSDGINLIANRYFVHEELIRGGLVGMTFFLADDARLRATYFERTRAYLAMYEDMIGPYPYLKFATVENWFPTGYGMPSYTLLGGQVLRLPFIPYTSFGHEIAHNWWGNSVFVDPAEGNWCEGLTVYCADYHYKALEGAEAAREYRRNNLKDYAAYVGDPARDFPLSEFRNRHSGATRAVGYGKSMMVFHMADRLVGEANFRNALRVVAAEHQFTAATWSDFMAAFAAAGDRDLTAFQAQWLTRAGAPELRLERTDFQPDQVTVVIAQSEPVYDLEVPVVVTSDSGTVEHVVRLEAASGEFTLAGRGIRQVAVDPDYHLFRRLHQQEIEATISQVLADDEPNFTTGNATPDQLVAVTAFADDWREGESAQTPFSPGLLPNGHASIVVNPDPELLARLVPGELQVAGTRIFLAGKRYDLGAFDLVCAVPDPADAALTDLVVLCGSPDRLARLAGRISHYGKYSWLLLPVGSGAAERGNWTAGDSPLTARDLSR